MGGVSRFARNARAGRLQRTLAATAAASAAPLALEVYLEHYRGSFADRWEWAPLVCTPPMIAAGVAGVASERAARTLLPAVSALYAANGVVGTALHLRGVWRRPGGLRGEPLYNLVMGPPLLAPGSFLLVGALGLLAGVVRRER
ncbi:MAG TPA: hypothetical protein VHB30_08955 [Solirubrobacteraceae bacterium]|jgi:hypothetical protein|nr:hypothetical protein [Solirubrobacteraceae bacterium]